MVVLCGSGNNGGDGYVVAQCAQAIGLEVVVIQAAAPKTATAIQVCEGFVDHGGIITNQITALQNTALIVDGLFGIGLNRAPAGFYADLIRATNQARCAVIALDVPSGLDGDTGFAFDPCIVASMTITFIGQKIGLLTGAGRNYSGEIKLEDLNLAEDIRQRVTPVATCIELPQRKKRMPDSHKGDYGNIMIAGGNNGMLGAVLLAGSAALRCGSGRVTILSTEKHLDMPALHCPELMSQCIENKIGFEPLCEQSEVVVLGPGLGLNDWSKRVFDYLIELHLNRQRPMLIDADGLTLLAEQQTENPRKSDYWILTPHPGEAAKLLACSTAEIQQDRIGAVKAVAAQFGGVCVLKGAGTLVADCGGVRVCEHGNTGMATAGMGDVLSGIIGSLMGQSWMGQNRDQPNHELGKIAATGVWLHSVCAGRVVERVGEASLLAGDVIDGLAEVLLGLEEAL